MCSRCCPCLLLVTCPCTLHSPPLLPQCLAEPAPAEQVAAPHVCRVQLPPNHGHVWEQGPAVSLHGAAVLHELHGVRGTAGGTVYAPGWTLLGENASHTTHLLTLRVSCVVEDTLASCASTGHAAKAVREAMGHFDRILPSAIQRCGGWGEGGCVDACWDPRVTRHGV